MKVKLLFLILLVTAVIYSHYHNKHCIMKHNREINSKLKICKSEKNKSKILLAENGKLSSRERIQKLAYTQLDMLYPKNKDNVHTIKIDKNSFKLIDYIVPTAEALTN